MANKEGGSGAAGEYSDTVSSKENLGTVMVPTALSTGMTQPLDPGEACDGMLP